MGVKLLFVTNLAVRLRVNPRIDAHGDDVHPTFISNHLGGY